MKSPQTVQKEPEMKTNKQTVLITGTSSGIGAAAVRLFLAQGWNVIATMRRPEQAPQWMHTDRCLVTKLDVTEQTSIDESIELGLKAFGSIDVLINNAGYGAVGIFEAATEDSIRQQYETNVFGLMAVTRSVLKHFRAQRSGTIVNVSSVGGRLTFPLYSLYHSTKFAVEGFSESLSYELEPLGIKVKLVEPGAVVTDFTGRSADESNVSSFDDYRGYQNNVMKQIKKEATKGISAEACAKTLYEAAVDDSNKLRFVAGSQAKQLLFLRSLIPVSTYQSLVKRILVK
jgi:short-subunit dehydrogenase